MGKSKSHPCKHPLNAQRDAKEAGFWCHKCKQEIDWNTMKPVKAKSEIPEPVPAFTIKRIPEPEEIAEAVVLEETSNRG